MVGAGGQMKALSARGPTVCICGGRPLVSLSVGSCGDWGILAGLMIRLSGTD